MCVHVIHDPEIHIMCIACREFVPICVSALTLCVIVRGDSQSSRSWYLSKVKIKVNYWYYFNLYVIMPCYKLTSHFVWTHLKGVLKHLSVCRTSSHLTLFSIATPVCDFRKTQDEGAAPESLPSSVLGFLELSLKKFLIPVRMSVSTARGFKKVNQQDGNTSSSLLWVIFVTN